MRVRATETAKSLGMNFNAARSWFDDRFMRREELSLRYRSSICQKTSDDFQKRLLNFQRYVIQLRNKTVHLITQEITDEMAVYFVTILNYTIDDKVQNKIISIY
jgi:hypothetical protein